MTSAGSLWAEMVAQESVDEIADSIFTSASVHSAKDEGLQERGTENYLSRLVGRGRKRKISTGDDETKGEGEETPYVPPPIREYESDSDVSSGGLSDDSYAYIKKNVKAKKLNLKQRIAVYRKHRLEGEAKAAKIRKVQVPEDKTECDGGGGPSDQKAEPSKIVELSGGDAMEQCQPATSYKVGQERSWKAKHFERLQSKKDDKDVAYYITKRLHEKKPFLIRNAVEIFGRDTCIRMFIKATKINFYGGLLIKKKYKKRTMGGIFMYLLKNDKKISEEKKTAFWEANTETEANKVEQQQNLKYEVAKDSEEKMDLVKNSIMERMNPSIAQTTKGQVWNIDDNEDYSVRQPQVKKDTLPERKVVDYSDMFEF